MIPDTFTDAYGTAHFLEEAYNILTRQGVTDEDRLALQQIIRKAQSQSAKWQKTAEGSIGVSDFTWGQEKPSSIKQRCLTLGITGERAL